MDKIKPFLKTEYGVLYNDDCLKIMKNFSEKQFGMILTDPPFGLGKKCYDNKPKQIYLEWYDNIIKEISRVLGFHGSLLIETSYTFLYESMTILNKYLNYKQPIIGYITNDIGRRSHCGWKKYITYLWYGKGSETKVVKKYMDLITISLKSSIRKFRYPNPKFVSFYETLIKMFSKEYHIIFDPFIGSGTTALACENLKRQWIGIEINKDYCEIIKKRLEGLKFG